ncbi:MAG: DegT/DnrJ/EryC1/StrS family aminotransferase [Candidatus Omnitrophota bacterium]
MEKSKRKKMEDWSGTGVPEAGLKVDYPEVCAMYGLEEVQAVVEAMQAPIYTLSSYTKRFQEEFAEYIGTKYAFAVTNAASALEMAAYLIGIKEGDEVIVPAITFFSTTLGILRLGGKVVFADIDPATYNLTSETIEGKITPKTRAIYVVHIYGLPADMEPILKLAKKYNLAVVEDCAHTPGAEYQGKKVGGFGRFGCFSFHTAKNITTLGEGGMITTNDDRAAEDIPALRHVGMVKYEKQKRFWIPYLYDIAKVRGRIPYNFCMNEIQAAVGRVQLRKLDSLNERRRVVAKKLTEGLRDIEELQLPSESPGSQHVYHLYPVLFTGNRDSLIETLHNKYSIRTVPLYPPVYYFTIYKEMGYKKGLCPIAERFYSRLINLPFTPALTDIQSDYLISSIKKAVKNLRG